MLNFMKIQIVVTSTHPVVFYWVGTSYYSVVLGEFFFAKSVFFSAELVSAQRLSALFSLLKFCSVASLNFKCLA